MQHLLNVVEDHGTQLHMRFGKEKCKLLISARPKMVKHVEGMLNDEPGLLTFFGSPVQPVEDFYVHIGVPQAPRNQSRVLTDYRIAKATDISYLLQGTTKIHFLGSAHYLKEKCLSLTINLHFCMELTLWR